MEAQVYGIMRECCIGHVRLMFNRNDYMPHTTLDFDRYLPAAFGNLQ